MICEIQICLFVRACGCEVYSGGTQICSTGIKDIMLYIVKLSLSSRVLPYLKQVIVLGTLLDTGKLHFSAELQQYLKF
jgi:hypothetical protein